MWRLLPAVLLLSCATQETPTSRTAPATDQGPRVVRQTELALGQLAPQPGGGLSRRSFERAGTEGWIDTTGGWRITTEVHHGRLRCATYEAGLQLGSGNPACSEVTWREPLEYVTRLRHCNSATRIHVGAGRSASVADATCVRVVVRCEGTC